MFWMLPSFLQQKHQYLKESKETESERFDTSNDDRYRAENSKYPIPFRRWIFQFSIFTHIKMHLWAECTNRKHKQVVKK